MLIRYEKSYQYKYCFDFKRLFLGFLEPTSKSIEINVSFTTLI